MESLFGFAVYCPKTPKQFCGRDDDEACVMLGERGQDEDPEVGLGFLDLLLLMGPPPRSHEFALEEDRTVSRGEVLGKLDLKGNRPSVLSVRDQEIYACV